MHLYILLIPRTLILFFYSAFTRDRVTGRRKVEVSLRYFLNFDKLPYYSLYTIFIIHVTATIIINIFTSYNTGAGTFCLLIFINIKREKNKINIGTNIIAV